MEQAKRALQKTEQLHIDGAKFTPIPMSILEGHDHESIVYLVKGRMTLTIGDKTFEAKAGDVWRHPIGVSHTSVALEDSVAIEIKSPPRKTWNFNN